MKWLLDEMLPSGTADRLSQLGHDAASVQASELAGADDDEVFTYAAANERVLVTENFADYARILEQRLSRNEPCVPVVFVRKSDFPRGGALAVHLARHLHNWAAHNPAPYVGVHWPERLPAEPDADRVEDA